MVDLDNSDKSTFFTDRDEVADESPAKYVITINYNIKHSSCASTHETERDLPPGENMSNVSFIKTKKRRRKTINKILGCSLTILPTQEYCEN